MGLRKSLDRLARKFGYALVKAHHLDPLYQHQYKGGYEEYRKIQIRHNKRKLENVWADETTLGRIVGHMEEIGLAPQSGVCHGARNGYEVQWFRERLGADVIGTDISETATRFPNMVVWDFHEENPEWEGKFDFIYTNSLDQAMEPDRALAAWARQLRPAGRIYIEHTMAHSTAGAGEMDPFGAHPMVMPYLFFTWGRGKYRLSDIIEIPSKGNKNMPAWVFVLERE